MSPFLYTFLSFSPFYLCVCLSLPLFLSLCIYTYLIFPSFSLHFSFSLSLSLSIPSILLLFSLPVATGLGQWMADGREIEARKAQNVQSKANTITNISIIRIRFPHLASVNWILYLPSAYKTQHYYDGHTTSTEFKLSKNTMSPHANVTCLLGHGSNDCVRIKNCIDHEKHIYNAKFSNIFRNMWEAYL